MYKTPLSRKSSLFCKDEILLKFTSFLIIFYVLEITLSSLVYIPPQKQTVHQAIF